MDTRIAYGSLVSLYDLIPPSPFSLHFYIYSNSSWGPLQDNFERCVEDSSSYEAVTVRITECDADVLGVSRKTYTSSESGSFV